MALRAIGYCAAWVSAKSETLVLHRSRITTEDQARATVKQWQQTYPTKEFVFRVETLYSEGPVDLPELSDADRAAFEACFAEKGVTYTDKLPGKPDTYAYPPLRQWWAVWKAARDYYYRRLLK